MADEQQELRRINWQEVFSFTRIFRCHQMARHPSKLLLATAAIVLVFVGGWVMDQVWAVGGGYAYPGEIWDYYTQTSMEFEQEKDQWVEDRLDEAARLLADAQRERRRLSSFQGEIPSGELRDAIREKVNEDPDAMGEEPKSRTEILSEAEEQDRNWSQLLSQASRTFQDELKNIDDVLDAAPDAARERIEEIEDDEDRQEAREQLSEHLALAQRAIAVRRLEFRGRVQQIRGVGIFSSFLDWQADCVSKAIAAVRYRNITGGLAQYRQTRDARDFGPMTLGPTQGTQDTPVPPDDMGFLYYVLLMWQGVAWLYSEHWVFALLLSLLTMAVVALFGGAVNRIAALHFARDERLSITQSLRFSCSKFFSFFTAPLIPLAVIVVLGLLLAVGGLFINIPVVGEILGGLLFVLPLVGGFVIAFLLVGLLAGAPLMYPTIAVEGSDSFDAISRSFSYIFNRPWRAIFYGLVALVYGVLTYLFVRLFAYLLLLVTHAFVGLGVFASAPSLHPRADKLDVLWTRPTFDSLFGSFNWAAMSGAQQIGAFLIGVWVFLVAAVVAAYLLTFAASSTTVIYFLLRRKVDATDLDDVYVEEPEDLPPPPEETPAEQPETDEDQTGESEQQPEDTQPPSSDTNEGDENDSQTN